MGLTKERVSSFHDEARSMLEALAKKHNLSIAKSHITYYEDHLKFNLELGDREELGNSNAIYINDLKKFGYVANLTINDRNKKFKLGAREYILEGMKTRRWVIAKNLADNKLYKLRPEDVAAVFAMTAASV